MLADREGQVTLPCRRQVPLASKRADAISTSRQETGLNGPGRSQQGKHATRQVHARHAACRPRWLSQAMPPASQPAPNLHLEVRHALDLGVCIRERQLGRKGRLALRASTLRLPQRTSTCEHVDTKAVAAHGCFGIKPP